MKIRVWIEAIVAFRKRANERSFARHFKRVIALTIIERQNNDRGLMVDVRTLGEVRKNKLAAAMHRSVLEVDAVHTAVTSFGRYPMDTGQA